MYLNTFHAVRQDAHKASFYKQREELIDWEKKLQESEKKLSQDRRLLNEREEKANQNDRMLRQREKTLEEYENKSEFCKLSVKEKENDINRRFEELVMKEKVGFFVIALPLYGR